MLSRRVVAPLASGVLLAVVLALAAVVLGGSSDAAAAPGPDESRSPYGEMNLAWSEPGLIGLVGWAKDPDVNRPIDVVVAIDNGGGLFVRRAGVYNPYLPGSYAEKFRSYLVAIPVSPGPHTMCVAALNVGRGAPFRLLGCRSFVIESPDPVGNLESVAFDPNGDAVTVSGWALDRENPFPLPMTVTVDGAPAGRLVASQSRPDVGGVFPASGSLHGFSGSIPASPGRRRICVTAQNLGRGADATVGCRDVTVPTSIPLGNVETAAPVAGGIRVSGWAGDVDSSSPLTIRVENRLVGSISDPVRTTHTAGIARSDVATATGLSLATGFDVTIPQGDAGNHVVCVVALNVGPGRDRELGCSSIRVVDQRPGGHVDAVVPAGNAVRVTGWALDAISPASAVTVRVTVDGAPTLLSTSVPRTDVAAAYPGARPASGFDTTIGGLAAGRHNVCVAFVGVGGGGPGTVGGDRTFPCGSVIVDGGPSGLAVGTTGIAGTPVPVGPTGALADVDRDAGVTTTLRDGSVLWLFGDSVAFAADGSLRYFVSGSGAWASASEPMVTRDAVSPSGAPYLLATPGESFPACESNRPYRALWPISAVTVPDGGRDRVIVHLANMCLSDASNFVAKGISVAEWYYDPASPPVGRPVQLTMLNPQLSLARAYGTASVVGGDGLVYLYQCDRPANPADLGAYGPCRVARTTAAGVGDVATYRYWNGSTWTVGDGGVALGLPVGALAGYRYPASAFTVTFDAAHGAYVMVYSPWPGYVDRAVVRVARSPEGPWSEPVEVTFPGCSDTVSGELRTCYAATAQPAFSTGSELGLGYYDQAVAAGPTRGQYQLVRVPFVMADD